MTTVYGVTPYGARQQIRGQLKNIEDFPQDHIPEASKYLSEKTFKCLEKMFTRTKEIQVCLTHLWLVKSYNDRDLGLHWLS